MEGSTENDPGRDSSSGPEGVGDALRAAVERTLAATAGSATETRQRAQGLLDDVVRRGQVAREEVARRSEEATARVAEAIGDLRTTDDGEGGQVEERLAGIERRIAALEARLHAQSNPRVEVQGSTQKPLGTRDPEA